MKYSCSYEDAFKESLKYFDGDALAAAFSACKYSIKESYGNISEKSPLHTLFMCNVEYKYQSPFGVKDWADVLDGKIDLHRRINDAVKGLGNFETYCAGYPYSLLEADSEKFMDFEKRLEEELDKVKSLRNSVKQRECMTSGQIAAAQCQMRVVDAHLHDILNEYGVNEDLAKQVNTAIESINKAYSDAPLYVLLYALEAVYSAYVKLAKDALDYEDKVRSDYNTICLIYDSFKSGYIGDNSGKWSEQIRDLEDVEGGLPVFRDIYKNRLLRNPVYIYKHNCKSDEEFLTGLYHNSSYTWGVLREYFEYEWMFEHSSNRISELLGSESSVSDYNGIFANKKEKEKALDLLREIMQMVDNKHTASYLVTVAFSKFKNDNMLKLRDDDTLFVDTIWNEVSCEVDCGLKSSKYVSDLFKELNMFHVDLYDLPENGLEKYDSKVKKLVKTRKYVEEKLFKGPVRITSSSKTCSPIC